MADITDVLASLLGGGLGGFPSNSGGSPIGLPTLPAAGQSPIGLPNLPSGGGSPIGLPTLPGFGVGSPIDLPTANAKALTMVGRAATALAADRAAQQPGAQAGQLANRVAPASVPAEYRGAIQEAAAKYGVDPALIAAQIKQESGFNPTARGPVTQYGQAQGIGQFIPSTARQYGVNVNDPASSIEGMAHYMSDLLRQYGGNQQEALAAYNGGAPAVQALRRGQPFGETQAYLANVLRNLETYRAETGQLSAAAIQAGAPPTTGYVFPVQGYQGAISLHHGSVRGGSDIMAPEGTPVVAMRAGTVTLAGNAGPGGNAVQITGDDGLAYYYAHLRDTPMVRPGQQVQAGTPLGAVGRTGNAAGTPPHLHIGIGPSIVTGVGAAGGTGGAYDAVALLQQALAAATGQ